MSTVVAVKKNGLITIAADTLSMAGNMKESSDFIVNSEKILRHQNNHFAFTGAASFKLVFQKWLKATRSKPKFDSVEDIFDSWLKLHAEMKELFFLRPDSDEADEFESSRMNVLIVNPKGIFTVGDLRDVTEYKRFTAFGSGSYLAIGAMQAVYADKNKSAEDIAKIGVEVAAEFDDATGLPMNFYTIKTKK